MTKKEQNRKARSIMNEAVKIRRLWSKETNKNLREELSKKIYALIDSCNEVAPHWCATFQKFDCGVW